VLWNDEYGEIGEVGRKRGTDCLSNPHICAPYGIGDHDGVPFLVMEHLEGETLEDRLREGPLALGQAFHHAVEIAGALAQAQCSTSAFETRAPRAVPLYDCMVLLRMARDY
jgi:hypothetical protein